MAVRRKSAAQLATEARMRAMAKLPNGGKSLARMATERKMRGTAAARKKAAATAETQRLRAYYKKNGHIPTLLSNESRRRFGEADPKDVSALGRQVAAGKITREEANRRIRQGAAVNNSDALRAGLDVSAELDPQINSAARRREILKRQYNVSRKTDQTDTQRERKNIAGIYKSLAGRLAVQPTDINRSYDAASTNIATGTQSLQDSIRSAYEQANRDTQRAVAGLGGGTTQGQTLGNQDQAFLSGLAGIQGQGQQGILATGRTGALNNARATANYGAFEGANTQATLLRELLQRQSERTSEFNNEDYELAGGAADLEESRFAQLYERRRALESERAQQAAEEEDRRFERGLAQARLQVDLGELDVKRTTANNNARIAEQRIRLDMERLGLDRQRVDILSRQTNARLAMEQRKYTPGTPEYQEIQAAIDLKRAQAQGARANVAIGRANAAANVSRAETAREREARQAAEPSRNRPQNFGKGIGGAQTYIRAATGDPGWQGVMNRQLSYTAANFNDFGSALRQLNAVMKRRNYPPHIQDAMRRMTGIYYGKSS